MTKLDIGQKTDRGLNPDRPVNEDAMEVVHSQIGDASFVIAVVADGMGGMDRGEDASHAAVKRMGELRPDASDLANRELFADWFVGTATEANAAVRSVLGHAQGGCTLTAVAFVNDLFVLAHVGDSRAYLRSAAGEVVRITNDHSLVALLVANGEMTEEEAEVSEERNAILRSLGSHDRLPDGWTDDLSTRRVLADSSGTQPARFTMLLPGEALVLVSDGVWGTVPSAEFNGIVNSRVVAQAMADELVAAALRHGAPDNATAVVIRQTALDMGIQRVFLGPQQPTVGSIEPAIVAANVPAMEPVRVVEPGGPVTKVMPAEAAPVRKSKTIPMAAAAVGLVAVGVLGFLALGRDSKKTPSTIPASAASVVATDASVASRSTAESTAPQVATTVVSATDAVVAETSVAVVRVESTLPANGGIVSGSRVVPDESVLAKTIPLQALDKDGKTIRFGSYSELHKFYSDIQIFCYITTESPYQLVDCEQDRSLVLYRATRLEGPVIWAELRNPPPTTTTLKPTTTEALKAASGAKSGTDSKQKPATTTPPVTATQTTADVTTTKKAKRNKTTTTKKPESSVVTTTAAPETTTSTIPVQSTSSTIASPLSPGASPGGASPGGASPGGASPGGASPVPAANAPVNEVTNP
jgi:serine/threonine protein phosphatase PrpC